MGAHIDAPGRLVENEEAGIGRQPAGEDHLLLIAAREELDRLFPIGGADVERLDIPIGQRFLFAARQRLGPAAPGLERQRDVLAYREIVNDAVLLAVFGAEAEALANGVTR